MSRILDCAVVLNGAVSWDPSSPPDKPTVRDNAAMGKKYRTVCIERDRISACLLEHIRENYNDSIRIRFNMNCTHVDWKANSSSHHTCTVHLQDLANGGRESVEAAFLVGADGTNSMVRESMLELSRSSGAFPFHVRRFEDTNVRLYRTIPMVLPTAAHSTKFQWPQNVSYSARVRSDVNLEALPGPNNTYLAVILFRPEDRRVTDLSSAAEARAFFADLFPAFLPCLREEDLKRFAKKRNRKFPRFLFAGPTLHVPSSRLGNPFPAACILGDSAHSVKPFFGLGVNSAFEDVDTLGDALRLHGGRLGPALDDYSSDRAPEAKTLVELSRQFDGGFLTFVLPLIVDATFHRLFPFLFSPPTITVLQTNRKYTEVRALKRKERVGQLFVVGCLFMGMKKLFDVLLYPLLVQYLWPLMRRYLPSVKI